ncbi:MAG: sugar phosphate nucleotidyltransferase, partial [Candidatus Acidiferrum sp.]
MKSMILAAGLGTRLRPLTNDRPKALVEINGRTLLEITIARLATFGVTEFIVNVHHFSDQVASYLQSKNNFGYRIELSREDDLLLDTGGGLKKAAWFFQENPAHLNGPFFLHNVDVLSNIDLNAMLQFHKQHDALATLAVQSRESSRQLLFNTNLQLAGRRIHNEDTLVDNVALVDAPASAQATNDASANAKFCHSERSEEPAFSPHSPLVTSHSPLPPSQKSSPLPPLAFSGIHVISPRLLAQLTESSPVFSIIDSYLRLSSPFQKILAFRHDTSY